MCSELIMLYTMLFSVFSPEIYIQMCTMNNQTLNGFVHTLLLNVKVTGSLRADTRTVYLIKRYFIVFCRQK